MNVERKRERTRQTNDGLATVYMHVPRTNARTADDRAAVHADPFPVCVETARAHATPAMREHPARDGYTEERQTPIGRPDHGKSQPGTRQSRGRAATNDAP